MAKFRIHFHKDMQAKNQRAKGRLHDLCVYLHDRGKYPVTAAGWAFMRISLLHNYFGEKRDGVIPNPPLAIRREIIAYLMAARSDHWADFIKERHPGYALWLLR